MLHFLLWHTTHVHIYSTLYIFCFMVLMIGIHMYYKILSCLYHYSTYYCFLHFTTHWVASDDPGFACPEEIRDIIFSDISLDSHMRLIIDTVHRYLYYLAFISLFIHISISLMITDPFCRYSFTYLCWAYCVSYIYSLY